MRFFGGPGLPPRLQQRPHEPPAPRAVAGWFGPATEPAMAAMPAAVLEFLDAHAPPPRACLHVDAWRLESASISGFVAAPPLQPHAPQLYTQRWPRSKNGLALCVLEIVILLTIAPPQELGQRQRTSADPIREYIGTVGTRRPGNSRHRRLSPHRRHSDGCRPDDPRSGPWPRPGQGRKCSLQFARLNLLSGSDHGAGDSNHAALI